MTSRLLISATVHQALVRRTRRADGALFGVAKVADRDRMERRIWKVFVNDQEIIERFEALRVGEPVAISGPFSIVPLNGGEVECRITAEQLVDTKKSNKSKTAKAKEQRVRSDEADDAPKVPEETGAFHDDPLPF